VACLGPNGLCRTLIGDPELEPVVVLGLVHVPFLPSLNVTPTGDGARLRRRGRSGHARHDEPRPWCTAGWPSRRSSWSHLPNDVAGPGAELCSLASRGQLLRTDDLSDDNALVLSRLELTSTSVTDFKSREAACASALENLNSWFRDANGIELALALPDEATRCVANPMVKPKTLRYLSRQHERPPTVFHAPWIAGDQAK
jgi:hypothetical protein